MSTIKDIPLTAREIAVECLKYNFPQINPKTRLVETKHSKIQIPVKGSIREMYLKEFEFGYRHVRAVMFVCYSNDSDILYIRDDGYTDIDLSLLK